MRGNRDNYHIIKPDNIHLGDDLMMGIARQSISGVSVVIKFGGNESANNNTEETIWDGGGTYSYPATALMTSISQTTDQAAMRGATIEVQGLDSSWDLVTQNALLNAANTTTIVTLITPLIRVFRMKVLANVINSSPIRIHNAAETVDYAIIATGNNQTLMAIYTVPNGKTALMISYYGDYVRSANKDPDGVKYGLWIADRDNSYEFQIKHKKGIPKQVGGFQHYFMPYFKIPQKHDIEMRATPSGADSDVHAGFDLILIDN